MTYQLEHSTGQCVTFYVGSEVYGVNIAVVQEIIRLPGIINVPRTPAFFEGLANLRGSILGVVDTRTRFGLEKVPPGDSSRVVVLDDGSKRLGFIVDKLSEVVSVADEDIEEIREAGGQAELLRGVARLEGGNRLVMVVDEARLMNCAENESVGTAGNWLGRERSEGKKAEAREEVVQLVSFRLGSEEYGLEIGVVQEIVHLPEVINQVPNAPAYLIGVMSLRSRVLPVVSLRELFRVEQKGLDDRARIIVVDLHDQHKGTITVGMVVDSVSEVLRVPRSLIDPVPVLVRAGGGEGITGVCKLAAGKRLVSVLDPTGFLPLGELLGVGSTDGGNQEGEDAGVRDEEEQLVTFRLGNEEFAANIAEVREIIRVPEIVAVPTAPKFVEGVINLRGTIIPTIDLRKRLGMEVKPRDEHTRIVVVEMNGLLTGVIVDSVREVLKVPGTSMEAVPEILAETVETRFMRGIAKVDEGERLIIMMDIREVLSFQEKEELGEFERNAERRADTSSNS